MPDNYYSELNENGVVTPLRDLAAFPRSEQAVLGAKNFLYVLDPTGTQSGVTYTVNKDSKGNVLNVAVSGMPTGYSAFAFWADVTPNEYILSHMDNATNFIWGEITLYKNGASVQDLPSLGTADDCTIDLSSYDFDRIKVAAKRVSNSVNTTATIYPMLRLATDTDSNYAPYAMTNRELTEKKVDKTYTSTDTKATIFSESSKVSSATAVLNDLLVSLRITTNSGVATSGAWTTIATLNDAYKPANLVYETAIDDAGNPLGWVRIHADGKVEVYHGAGTAKTVNLSSLYFRA